MCAIEQTGKFEQSLATNGDTGHPPALFDV